jgi:hypothetical protein
MMRHGFEAVRHRFEIVRHGRNTFCHWKPKARPRSLAIPRHYPALTRPSYGCQT